MEHRAGRERRAATPAGSEARNKRDETGAGMDGEGEGQEQGSQQGQGGQQPQGGEGQGSAQGQQQGQGGPKGSPARSSRSRAS